MKTFLQKLTFNTANQQAKKWIVFFFVILCCGTVAQADVVVTPATFGTSVSADNAANAAIPVYTVLGDIVITESDPDDFNNTGGSAKTFILTAPAGWVFNPAAGSVAVNSAIDISSVSVSVSATEITITLDVTGIAVLDVLTISGIEVQALDGAILPSAGQLYNASGNAGTATIDGVINTANTDGSGGTNFGSLSQTAGLAAVLVFTTEPASATVATIFGQQPVVITEDQFGNSSVAGLGVNKNVTLSLSSGTGILSGTTTLDIGTGAGNGMVNFTDLQINAAGIKKLMANAAGLTFAVTNDFTVNQASTSTTLLADINPSCFGADVILTANIISNLATGTVEFFDGAVSLGSSAITAGTATLTVSTLSAGAHSLTAVYSGDADYLTSTSIILTHNVNPPAPATPGSITGATAVCPNDAGIVYSIAAVTDATTYTWTVPAGWSITSGAGTISITVTAGIAGQDGDITVTAGNSCGTSSAQTLAVVVNPATPATPGVITGVTAVCPNDAGIIYSIAPVTDAATYTWAVPTGWSITSGAGTTSITVTAGIAGQDGDITVTAGNSCGTSSAQTLAVVVNPSAPATPGVITGATTVCPNDAGIIYSIAPVTDAATYTWTVPTGWTITSGAGTTSITVTAGIAGQDGDITVTAGNSCGNSSAQTLAVVVNPATPATPGVISGASPVCPNVAGIVYSIAPVANATTYTWTVPAGWTITAGAGTSSVTVTSGIAGGNITVSAGNFCGNSAAQMRAITLNPAIPATPGTITGAATVCPSIPGNIYSISAVANATSYTWVVPAGWNITAGAGTTSITVTSGTAGQNGNITVTANNSCGNSTAQTLAAVVSPVAPSAPGTITGPTPVCPNTTGLAYSVAAVANATSYTWVVPAGWSVTAGAGTNSITVTSGAAGGTITVAAVNFCGSSDAAQTININPVNATDHSGWTDNNGPKTTGNIQANNGGGERRGYIRFPLTAIPAGATINSSILRLTNNGSGASGATNFINALGNNDPVSTAAAALYTAAGTGANYNSSTWANTGQISLTLNAAANAGIQGRITVPGWLAVGLVRGGSAVFNFFGNASGANAPVLSINYAALRSLAVTMNPPVPATPGVITGAAAVCANTAGIVYSIAAVTNATSYTWTVPTGWTINSGQGTTSISVTAGNAGDNGNITVYAGNSCGNSAIRTRAVTVDQVPTTSNAGTGQNLCMPATNVVLAANTPIVGTGAWSVVSGPSTLLTQFSNTTNPTATFTRAGGAGTYQLRWTITNGVCVSQSTVNIVFTTAPAAPNISFNQTLNDYTETIINCGPVGGGGENDVDIYNYTPPGGATFNWQYSSNAGPWTNSGLPNTSTEYPIAAFASINGVHNFRMIMQVGGCTVTSNVITLTVNPISSIGSTTGNACSGVAFTVSPTGFPGGTTYTWTAPAVTGGLTGGVAGSGNSIGGNLTNPTGSAQTATYTVTPVYSGGAPSCVVTFTVVVTVNPRPTVNATPATQTRCTGVAIGTITITNPNSVPGTNLTWIRNNTTNLTGIAASGSGAAINGTLTNNTAVQQTTVFTVTATAGSCSSATTVNVIVNPLPVANSGGNQTLCTTLSSTVIGANPSASGGSGPYTYTWSPATGLSASNVANPTATPPSYPYVYSLTVTDANGCTSLASNATISQGAVTKTWNGDGVSGGTNDNNFNNPQNWIPKGVPSDCNDVIMNVEFTSFILGTVSNIDFNANVTIKSLTTQLSGAQFFNFTPTIFRLNVGTRALNILNNTALATSCTGIPISNSITQISVGNAGVVTYGGNLTTSGTATTNQVMPFYASTNNAGKFYVKGNAALGNVGNDLGNKPAQVIFDGTGTQTITHNSGAQTIYLGFTSTEIGETNAPLVILSGAGTGGYRNMGNLNVNSNATLDVAQQLINRNSAGGSINLAAGSTMKLGRNNGGVGTCNFPSLYATYNFNQTSTVEYNAPIAQTVHHVPLYGNLTLSNSNNKNPTGDINVQKNITILGSAIFIGGVRTITLGGNWTSYGQAGFLEQTSIVNFNSTGPQSINTTAGEIFYELRKTASGTLTQLSDVALQGGGVSAFTQSAGTYDAGTFRFNSATSALNMSAGLLKLARLNTTLPEYDIAAYNLTGGTIELYGSGDQVLRGARAYRNLTFSNSGVKTITSAITSITGTVLTNDAVILDVSNNTMGGAGTNLTMTGTSLYRTAGTGTKPDALGTYTLGAGTTIDFSNNSALTTEDIRLTLPVYYNLQVSGTNVANPPAATGILFQNGGTFTVKNGGIFKLGNSNGFTGSVTSAINNTNNPAIVLETGSTVEYYGGPLGTNAQTITNALDYEGLSFSGSSVKTAPAGILTVKGNLSNINSAFNHNNGTVLLNGTAAQDYNSAGTILQYYNFNIGNPVNVNVNGNLYVEKQLSLLAAGRLNFVSGDITLRSTATHTANVDKINTTDAITYGTGRFVIERYIATGTNPGQHIKSWQFLAVPLNTTQTVKDAWQEGALTANGNPNPGYGTQITSNISGALALGFDVYTAPGPSMKTYDHLTNGWAAIPNTTSLPITNQKGYMVFVRGDRSVTAFNQPANTTTLRSRGKLYAPASLPGDAAPPTTVLPSKFEAIGNPYASAIDFTLVTKSGDVDEKYYVWDPLLTANYNGLGGYQTISQANGWKPIPGGTVNYDANIAYQLVQSGQAFMVYSTGAGGTISFTEACKVPDHHMVFRAPAGSNGSVADRQFLRAQLYNVNNQQALLSDGNVLALDEDFSNDQDPADALKIGNTSENFGITRNSKIFSLETRKPVVNTDTVHYQLSNLRRQTYQLRFTAENIAGSGMEAILVDKFTGSTSPVSLSGSTAVDFTVTTEPGSSMPDRFYIIFKALRPVPVTITSISANRNSDASIDVKWKVENETSLENYTIERSENGRNFEMNGNALPKMNNGGSASYSHTDLQPAAGNNYYRIKATSLNGLVQYSQIVKVAPVKTNGLITVYPNPVIDKTAWIYFKNSLSGTYQLQLTNTAGQVLYRGSLKVNTVSEKKSIALGKEIASGNYHLSITEPDGTTIVRTIFIQ